MVSLIFGPQSHIEDAIIWNCVRLCMVGKSNNVLAPIRKFCAKDMNKILELDCA